ncbi:fused response regulator/phosphatase [Alkalimonas delamerensis]|uniref:Fused response regulator/phosphatase n=1 Tax=Alkalimonas delamerensis TaxID=265981 RepID=A0ABT9GNF6_9GAMM|nr:fused response regulator/phosphatase [Alkalimonas delamerensis]MDP4528496.1 fused response regulator/phosphatase [Alkalimonas delamerensis]
MHLNPVLKESLNFLIVEDDLLFNALYENFLLSKDATVHCAYSLKDASLLLQQHPNYFDAVILDNQLPDGQGLDLLPKLNLGSKVTAVIMVSGNDDADFFLTAFSAGIHDYMVKPVNLELLWLKVTRSVREQQLIALTNQQKQALENWVEQEQQQQLLAKHLFQRMFEEVNQPHPSIHAWLKPHGIFSGDAILRCAGSDGCWYFFMADAMGHGLAPAISLMPILRTFQAMATKSLPLPNITYEMNRQLTNLLPDDRFVAAVMIKLDPWQQQLEVWNGGMPNVLFLNQQGDVVQKLRSQHMALGVLSGQHFSAKGETFPLHNLHYMLVFSDGLTETALAQGDTMTEQQLIASLQINEPNPLMALTAQFDTLQADDDISACLVNLPGLVQTKLNDNEATQTKPPTSSVQMSILLSGSALVSADVAAKMVEWLKEQQVSIVARQKVFTVLTELYVNALEHGVLQLSSDLKRHAECFEQYYLEKQKRETQLTEDDTIEISLRWSASESILYGEITDSGAGFKQPDDTAEQCNALSGRGLGLIEQLTSHFEIIPPGNRFRFTMDLTKL